MAIRHTMLCRHCAYSNLDHLFTSSDNVKEEERIAFCPACGHCKDYFIHLGHFSAKNFEDFDNSEMYGKFWPSLGEVIHDAAHKRRRLKELGLIEAGDLVGGSRAPEVYAGDDKKGSIPIDDIEWEDTPDERRLRERANQLFV